MTTVRPIALLGRGSVPRYRQIEAILRDQIWSGELNAGDQMPTEEELGRMFHVSRPTVRQALQILEKDKLICREAGRGTFVNAIAEEFPTERRLIHLSELVDFEKSAEIEIQRSGTLAARGQIQTALQVEYGEEVFYLVRMFRSGGQLFGAAKVHLPLEVGRALPKKDMLAPKFLERIAARTGAEVGPIDFCVDAVLADARMSEIFETYPGAPLISVRRTTFALTGAPIEYSHILFRSDLCRLSFQQQLVWSVGTTAQSPPASRTEGE